MTAALAPTLTAQAEAEDWNGLRQEWEREQALFEGRVTPGPAARPRRARPGQPRRHDVTTRIRVMIEALAYSLAFGQGLFLGAKLAGDWFPWAWTFAPLWLALALLGAGLLLALLLLQFVDW